MTSNRFVLLTEFENTVLAHSMRVLLEASGLEALVHGDFSVEIGSVEFAKLLVRESDLEIARRIIDEVPAASDVLVPPWRCPCGQEVDAGFQICWSCGGPCPDGDIIA